MEAEVDLYEYQARDLFEAHGVPTLKGIVATSAVQAEEAATKLGTPVVVVKAQIKTGGRGKAGGVKLAHSPAEAAEKANEILGLKIKGHTVRKVMVAEGADIAEEYYFSILLDRTKRRYLAMLSKEGGVEIEKLAEERPDALIKRSFSPLDGMTDTLARDMAYEAGFDEGDVAKLVPVFKKLYTVYTRKTPRWWKLIRWSRRQAAKLLRSMARSRWMITRSSATPSTATCKTTVRPTRWSSRRRRWG